MSEGVSTIKKDANQKTSELPYIQAATVADKTPKHTHIMPQNSSLPNSKTFDHLKIGEIARNVLRNLLEAGHISNEEIELMQTKNYSKQTFDIQYPLLVKASATGGISPKRYYSQSLTIKGERYFLCSEWYELPSNNDRPYLIKWLTLHDYEFI